MRKAGQEDGRRGGEVGRQEGLGLGQGEVVAGGLLGLQSKAAIFNLNRSTYVIRTVGSREIFFPSLLFLLFFGADIAEQSKSISDPELY